MVPGSVSLLSSWISSVWEPCPFRTRAALLPMSFSFPHQGIDSPWTFPIHGTSIFPVAFLAAFKTESFSRAVALVQIFYILTLKWPFAREDNSEVVEGLRLPPIILFLIVVLESQK